ncbi:MAG: o-antigen exporter, permease protein [Pseudomonadota bacterium]|jgi:lipopolysaccharide transport system permease protein
MLRNLKELYQYRALLSALIARELKARYRGSSLGFLWTFLNPTLLMLVYALIFSVYMRQSMERYLLFMFVGLLPWIWFSGSVGGGASAISDRRDLLTKVKFPAQVLPATVVLTNAINYLFALPLVGVMMIAYGMAPTPALLLLPVLVLVQLCFTLGCTYLVSAINVTFRDMQHIVSNLMTLWFFLTPILYPVTNVPEQAGGLPARTLVLYLNPMSGIIAAYQDVLYYQRLPSAGPLLVSAVVSAVLLVVSAAYFESRREDFAEFA